MRDLAFRNAPDPEHMLWRITPFIDYPRDTGADGAAVPYDWRWEREWRVRGDLAFQNDDVAILFVPGAQHEWITEWWKQEMIEGWGGYMPPTVDPNWPRERQEDVIRQGPTVLEIEMAMPVEPGRTRSTPRRMSALPRQRMTSVNSYRRRSARS